MIKQTGVRQHLVNDGAHPRLHTTDFLMGYRVDPPQVGDTTDVDLSRESLLWLRQLTDNTRTTLTRSLSEQQLRPNCTRSKYTFTGRLVGSNVSERTLSYQ